MRRSSAGPPRPSPRTQMQLNPLVHLAAAVLTFGTVFPTSMALPDEGMWPFDGLPLQVLKEKYNFEPTKEWLEHVRLGSVRFDTGGSGSFVSANGLVMTNHHVALATLQKIATPEKDWVKDGFSARTFGSEPHGVELTLRQLIEIKNVTNEVMEAAKGKEAPEAEGAREARLKELCDASTDKQKHILADKVVLYDGQEFRIYVYHIYEDVRVVFAPEKQ